MILPIDCADEPDIATSAERVIAEIRIRICGNS